MRTFKVIFYADGAGPLRTEQLSVPSVQDVRSWTDVRVSRSQAFSRARIYENEALVSEVGFRINRLA